MPSFDIVSELDKQEVRNAIDQANRELTTRFDFKGTGATFELDEYVVTLKATSKFQLKQMLDILKPRLAARNIDIRCMDIGEAQANVAARRRMPTTNNNLRRCRASRSSTPRRNVRVWALPSGIDTQTRRGHDFSLWSMRRASSAS